MKKILLIISLFTSMTIFAEEKSPAERMMIAMGVDKVLQAQREAYKADAAKQVAMLMKQLEGTLSGLPKETSQEIEKAMTLTMKQLLDSWNVETAIKVYSEEWNKNYTQLEIEQVIKKYENPSAKKEIEVVMAASAALNQYISTSYNSALEKSIAELIQKIQQVITKGKKETQSTVQPTVKAATI